MRPRLFFLKKALDISQNCVIMSVSEEQAMIEQVAVSYEDGYRELDASGLDMPRDNPTDNEVIAAVEQEMALDAGTLSRYVVWPDQAHADRPGATSLQVRPLAKYGAE